MKFTDEQNEIIKHRNNHALINAVAGSGKTSVMVEMIKILAIDDIDPKKIMVLMYNVSAKNDFTKKLYKSFSDSDNELLNNDRLAQIRTLSSLSYRLVSLLQSSECIPEYQLIFDNIRLQNNLIRKALKAHNLKQNAKNIDYLKEIVDFIKSRHDDIIEYNNKTDSKAVELFKTYEDLRHSEKIRFAIDWSYDTLSALKKEPDLKSDILSSRYQYIIVDEFQDINDCQMQIIEIFISKKTKIIVIGDVNQSIYTWRGSDPKIMLKKFPEKYSPTVYSLSKTFRFGQDLSDMANKLISNNKEKFDFSCESHESVLKTQIHILKQSDYLPSVIIDNLLSNNSKLSDIAVVARESNHWFSTEIDLLKNKIPYNIISGNNNSVLESNLFISLLGYLELADDAVEIKQRSVDDRKLIINNMLSMPYLYLEPEYKKELIERLSKNPDSYEIFNDIKRKLKNDTNLDSDKVKWQIKAMEQREEIWDICLGLDIEKSNCFRAVKLIISCPELNFYKNIQNPMLRTHDIDYQTMILNEFTILARDLDTEKSNIKAFVSYLKDLQNSYNKSKKDKNINSVSFITMHSSKGLEWDNVIIPNLNANSMPVKDKDNQYIDIEGDRRLFYVAMTRTKKNLFLISNSDKKTLENSCFINEILV